MINLPHHGCSVWLANYQTEVTLDLSEALEMQNLSMCRIGLIYRQ